MCSDKIAVRVEGLSKCYQIYDRPQDRLRQAIMPRLRALTGRTPGRYYREFWALREVSFEVARGETVGIIGRNGSGKSTLLQMICGTLEPTTGAVETRGRIAALLELGAGFNPEFTGRENVYLNATVLGLSQVEINARFEQIVAFADIGDFIEQPVKHYSSGMYARLAFAVAINVDPDILIVDEALAVGDEPFQRKCFARIEQISQAGGTILFVSHASGTIVELCDRALVLHSGEQIFVGKPKHAVGIYHKLVNLSADQVAGLIPEIDQLSAKGAENDVPKDDAVPPCAVQPEIGLERAYFDAHLRSVSTISYQPNGGQILEPRITRLDTDEQVNCLISGETYRFRYRIELLRDHSGLRLYSAIKTVAGVILGGGTWPPLGMPGCDMAAGDDHQVSFIFCCRLNAGMYFFNCGVEAPDSTLVHRIIDALPFRVLANRSRSSTATVDFDMVPELMS